MRKSISICSKSAELMTPATYLGSVGLSPVPGYLGWGEGAPGHALEIVFSARHHGLVLRHYLDSQRGD